MKQYKAIITDLDGTLITQNALEGFPTEKVTSALKKAQQTIHVGIATGRPPIYAYHLFDHLELSGPSIFLNGAIVVDSHTKKVIYTVEILEKDFQELTRIFADMSLVTTLDETDIYAKPYNFEYIPKHPLVLFVKNLTQKQVEEIQKKISFLPTLTSFQVPDWSDKSKWALHICHVTATKQYAVITVAEYLKISPEEIIGIGDSYNDFPLLMACGLKVAMGNAVEDLKAIADYIAPSVEEDGVADVIEKFIL